MRSFNCLKRSTSTKFEPLIGKALGYPYDFSREPSWAISGPNLVRVDLFEQFRGKYGLSSLTTCKLDIFNTISLCKYYIQILSVTILAKIFVLVKTGPVQVTLVNGNASEITPSDTGEENILPGDKNNEQTMRPSMEGETHPLDLTFPREVTTQSGQDVTEGKGGTSPLPLRPPTNTEIPFLNVTEPGGNYSANTRELVPPHLNPCP